MTTPPIPVPKRPRELIPGHRKLREEIQVQIADVTARQENLALRLQGTLPQPQPRRAGERPGIGGVESLAIAAAATTRPFKVFGIPIPAPGLAALTAFGLGPIAQRPEVTGFVPTIKTPEIVSQSMDLQAQLKQEGESLAADLRRIQWRDYILELVPQAVALPPGVGQLRTLEDLLDRYAAHFNGEVLTQEDISWANRLLQQSIKAVEYPKPTAISQERRDAWVVQMGRRRSASAYGIMWGSSKNLSEHLTELMQPRLPQEFTSAAEFRGALKDMGFDDEEIAVKMEAFSDEVGRLSVAMMQADEPYAIMQGEFRSMELDKIEAALTRVTVERILDRPMAALLLPVDWYREKVAFPFAGFITRQRLKLPAEPPLARFGSSRALGQPFGFPWLPAEDAYNFERLFRESKAAGLSDFRAQGFAFENYGGNGLEKFILETLTDPLSYVGFGWYAKALRHVPKVGPPLAGIELGYMKAVDDLALGVKTALYKYAPKTVPQIVRSQTRNAANLVKAVSEAYSVRIHPSQIPKRYSAMPFNEVKEAMHFSAGVSKANPRDTTAVASMGKVLRGRAPLTQEQLDVVSARVALPGQELETGVATFERLEGTRLSELDHQLGQTLGLEGSTPVAESATHIMDDILQILEVPDGSRHRAIQTWVQEIINEVDTAAFKLVDEASSTADLLTRIGLHVTDNAQLAARSPTRAANQRLAIMGSKWHTLRASVKLPLVEKLDQFQRGFARMYLLFAFYSPFNALENSLKTVLAGMSPAWSGDAADRLLFETVGMRGLPDIFERRLAATLELGALGEGARTPRGRLTGISVNTWRRALRTERSAWQRIYGALDEALIRSGGHIGLQQQANYLSQAMKRALESSADTGPVLEQAERIIQSRSSVLRMAGMGNREADWVVDEAMRRLRVNVASLPELGASITPAKIHASDILKKIGQYPDLGPVAVNHLVAKTQSDELIPQLTRLLGPDGEAANLMRQEVMHSPEMARRQITKLLDELIAAPPATLEELQRRIQTLQFLGTDTSNVISIQTQVTQREYADAVNLEFKGRAYEEMWDNILLPYIHESQGKLLQYAQELKSHVRQVGRGGVLTDDQMVSYDKLLDQHINRSAIMATAWEQHRDLVKAQFSRRDAIYAEINATGQRANIDHPRVRSWWEGFHSARETHWRTVRQLLADADSGILELGTQLDAARVLRPIDASGRPLTASDISQLFDSVPADLTRAVYIPEIGAFSEKVMWTSRVYKRAQSAADTVGRTAEDMGFSREAIGEVYDSIIKDITGSADVTDLLAPRMAQLEALRREVFAYAQKKNAIFSPQMSSSVDDFSRQVLQDLQTDDVTKRLFAPEWQESRQSALDKALDEFALDFPDYTNETALNSLARFVAPFWTYEAHRFQWLARTWAKKPGTFAFMDRYHDYTDQGYVRVPNTSWQFNPLRGTIWMGGLRRLMIRDYPDYYDQFPELANVMDQLSRYGIYTGIHLTGPMAAFGAAKTDSPPQFGELLPPIAQTALEAYVLAQPDSFLAKRLLETLVPSRFRDYLVAQKVNEVGGPGDVILSKKYSDTKLSNEDEEWWARGQRGTAIFNLAAIHTGLIRLRPEEKVQFIRDAREVIEEATGIPAATQEAAYRSGQRLHELFPLRYEVRELVNELESATRWRGMASHLRESEVGSNMATLKTFYAELEDASGVDQGEQLSFDRQFQQGIRNLPQWKSETRRIRSNRARRFEEKRKDPRFIMDADGKEFPVPLTMKERAEFAALNNLDPVTMPAEDELAAMYFEIELTESFNFDVGGVTTDWDLYFAKRRLVEQAAAGPRASLFYERVHKRDTPLLRNQRRDHEEYLRPYNATFDLVLSTFSEEEQQIIREAKWTSDEDRRLELMAQERPDGTNIVSAFTSELTEFRSRLRVLDPEMDARLMLWEGRSAKTDQASAIYRTLRRRYGFTAAEPAEGEAP